MMRIPSMNGPRSRRAVLKRLVAGAAGASACGAPLWAALAQGTGGSIAATPVSDRVTLFSGAGSNVAALEGPEGVVLVDGGDAEHSAALLDAIAERYAGRPVTALFNTHWHWDHTGSNEAIGAAGAPIIAHEDTRLWLGAQFRVNWEDKTYQPRPAHAWPTRTFYVSDEMELAGETIECGHLARAHTDCDIYVRFRGENVVAVGDVISEGAYPILDTYTGGWIGELRDATGALADMIDDDTRVIAGQGTVLTREHVRAQHEMLVTVYDRFNRMVRQGMGPDDLIANGVTAGYDEAWGDPTLFIHNAYEGISGHFREFRIA